MDWPNKDGKWKAKPPKDGSFYDVVPLNKGISCKENENVRQLQGSSSHKTEEIEHDLKSK